MAACWICEKPIDDVDAFCRHCGKGQGKNIGWYYHPVAIGLLAIFALGPFVIPLIWKSPNLSQKGRLIGTILVVLMTFYMFWCVYTALNMLAPLLRI